jgi:uncharacterized membrane protein/protein-disulfide isomerase
MKIFNQGNAKAISGTFNWENHQKTSSLPIYVGGLFLIAFGGTVISIYLSISHFRVYTDIGYVSFCAISRAINCDTVSQSPFSIFLGLPVPLWGVMGYALFLIFLLLAHSKEAGRQRLWPLLFLLAAGFSFYSVVLAIISTYWIRSYCLMCIVSYVVNFALMYLTWLVLRRFVPVGWWQGIREDVCFVWQRRKKFGAVFLSFGAGVLLLVTFFPAYWHFSASAATAVLPNGVTEDGHPWIGAEKPELTIEEFTDYQCFQCKKMHFFLRRLVAQHPDKFRLVHRNYPLDHELNPIVVPQPYHVGSGKMALLANAAGLSGKFWEMNDLLFGLVGQTDTLKIKDLAEGVGMAPEDLVQNMNSPKAHRLLLLDVREGMRANMTGTPAYRIDGEVYLGQIPPSILEAVLP